MIRTIEILSLISTLVLAALWILNPSGNYEPFTIVSGLVLTAAEIFRRRTSNSAEPKALPPLGEGGAGGNAKVGSGSAVGGKGGDGGVPGGSSGGAGGNAEVTGHGFALGGEGGEAGQADRGGRGGRSPFETLGVPNHQLPDGRWLWEFGRGGDGGGPQHQGAPDESPPNGKDADPSSR